MQVVDQEVVPGSTWETGSGTGRRAAKGGCLTKPLTPWHLDSLHAGVVQSVPCRLLKAREADVFVPSSRSPRRALFQAAFPLPRDWPIHGRSKPPAAAGVHSQHPEVCGGERWGAWGGIPGATVLAFCPPVSSPRSLAAVGTGSLSCFREIVPGSSICHVGSPDPSETHSLRPGNRIPVIVPVPLTARRRNGSPGEDPRHTRPVLLSRVLPGTEARSKRGRCRLGRSESARR